MLQRAKSSIKHNKLYYEKNNNKFIHFCKLTDYFKVFNITEIKIKCKTKKVKIKNKKLTA